ncbi:unnamed protein product [Lepidochelys kempii]
MKGFPGLITIVRDLIPEDNFEESCKSCRIRWVPNKVAILHPTLFLSHHEAEGSGQPVLRYNGSQPGPSLPPALSWTQNCDGKIPPPPEALISQVVSLPPPHDLGENGREESARKAPPS